MVEVRRVGVLSLALMLGLINAALGLIIGLLFACSAILFSATLASATEDLGFGGGGILLMAALLILPLVAYAPFGEQVLRDSRLAPYVTVVADLANRLVPEGMSEEYRAKVESLRRYWRERWAEASARAV